MGRFFVLFPKLSSHSSWEALVGYGVITFRSSRWLFSCETSKLNPPPLWLGRVKKEQDTESNTIKAVYVADDDRDGGCASRLAEIWVKVPVVQYSRTGTG